MKLFANIKNFAADESGAVTVDWVVLTAAIVGLGIAVIASVSGGVNNLADRISTSVAGTEIGVTPTTPNDDDEGEG
ncbi:MAG: hypothetical protein JJU08_11070 [Rhodobacteraceae bacterium]|nr:hypothetical protein [Paracoccaceae bacterium]